MTERIEVSSAPFPMHPWLEGYLAGMVAIRSEIHVDGFDMPTWELPEVDETLVERADFQEGVNEAIDFRKKMERELPRREFLNE